MLDCYKGHEYPERVSFRLRWRDMDAMAHVNHTLFLTYFEQARCEIWGASGLVLDGKGEGPILRKVSAEFKAPLSFPDEVTVGVRTVQLSAREYEQIYACASHTSGRVVAVGTAQFVNFDYDVGRPADLSDTMRRKLFGSSVLASSTDGGTDAVATRLQTLLRQGFSPAKEKLVALGGTVSTERVGSTDDERVLRCVAELGGQRLTATSAEADPTELEQRVARQLLDSVFSDDAY